MSTDPYTANWTLASSPTGAPSVLIELTIFIIHYPLAYTSVNTRVDLYLKDRDTQSFCVAPDRLF
eukprot:4267984-Pleurochrysis_carterae.AAC.7